MNLYKNLGFFLFAQKIYFGYFETLTKKVEIKTQYKLEYFRNDEGKKFPYLAFKNFYKFKKIIFGYILLYIHKDNSLVKGC